VPLILASASERRAELLTAAGFTFDVRPADVDETPMSGETPVAYALRVARDKAEAVRARMSGPADVILGADTVVIAQKQMLGKPADRNDARRMLRLLSGSTHEVLTAIVVLAAGRSFSEAVTTRVTFVPLNDREIEWYVNTDEPVGKAGGYAIQGRAARFIDRIEGSWSNVVGLPVAAVYCLLRGAAESAATGC
jgi:septum formation protein